MNSFTRAQMLRMLGAAALLPTVAAKPAPHRWGLESGTILVPLENDFHRTLRAVARMGYADIGTAGSFGRDPVWVRDALRAAGLSSASCHLTPDTAYRSHVGWARRTVSAADDRRAFGEALSLANAERSFEQGLASAKIIGQRYVVWSILLPEHIESRAAIDAYIALFNRFSETCRRESTVFAIHNHAREFARLGNDVIFDLILRHTDPRIKIEMDLFWMAKAGADPRRYFRDFPDRFRLVHVKDMDAQGEVTVPGEGTLDMPALIAAGRAAGIGHFLVEIDKSRAPLAALARAIAYLRRTIG